MSKKKPQVSISQLDKLEAEKDYLRSRDRQLAHGIAHLMMNHEASEKDLRDFFDEWITIRESANQAADKYWALRPYQIRRRRKPTTRKKVGA